MRKKNEITEYVAAALIFVSAVAVKSGHISWIARRILLSVNLAESN